MTENYVVDTIALTPSSRLTVHVDTDSGSASPRDWNNGASVHPIRQSDRYVPPAPGLDSHGSAIDEILHMASEDVEEAVGKHFTRAGIPFVIAEHNSGRDWVGVFVWYVEPNSTDGTGWTEATLRQEIKTYQQWADGEVYTVSLERTRELYLLDDDGNPYDEPTVIDWECVDSIGDCYLDDETYPAELAAVDHFDLTEEELAAIRPKVEAIRPPITEG